MSVSKQTLTASVLVAGLAGLMSGGVLGCVGGYQAAKVRSGEAGPTGKQVYSREEFRAAVMGKTPEQILKLLGRPDQTSEDTGSGSEWVYYDRRRDPLTGKLDELTFITFLNGRVIEVR